MIEDTPNGQTQYLVDGEPVAAQEPVGYFTVSQGKSINQIIFYTTGLPDGRYSLYTNAAPCARCAERPSAADYGELNELYQTAQAKMLKPQEKLEDRIENYASIHLLEENEKLRAKITEQAAEIERLKQMEFMFNKAKAFVMTDDNDHPVISFLPITLKTRKHYKCVAEYIKAAMEAELEKDK